MFEVLTGMGRIIVACIFSVFAFALAGAALFIIIGAFGVIVSFILAFVAMCACIWVVGKALEE